MRCHCCRCLDHLLGLTTSIPLISARLWEGVASLLKCACVGGRGFARSHSWLKGQMLRVHEYGMGPSGPSGAFQWGDIWYRGQEHTECTARELQGHAPAGPVQPRRGDVVGLEVDNHFELVRGHRMIRVRAAAQATWGRALPDVADMDCLGCGAGRTHAN